MFAVLAAFVVLLHLAFVIFVVAGGLCLLRWPRAAWAHVPVLVWGVWIEWSGGVCPLTPLENALRARAGLAAYDGDFIARWIFPLLYPAGLTREAQWAFGLAAVVINVIVYAGVISSRARRRARDRS
ncbi:MAG: DUF2784 domain-containing protein [Acidobacteriota bacterium]